ncbi:MAG: site-specific integrase [Acidobacteria bacterium]|nr:site-specific integrase [Acidobacteriota bacterium]
MRKIRPSDIEHYKLQRLNTPVEIPTNVLVYDPYVKKNVKKKKVVTRPRKIASVNRELELLRAMLNFAKSEGAIMVSPFETGTKLISTAAEVERDRVLSIDEERRLLDASVGRRAHIRPLIILAVDTAMRRGELFKLRWEDVDLPLRQITIKAENAKTERTRLVGLTERAVKELENLWDRSPKDVRGLVFGITSTVKNAWKSLRQECGLSDLRFHDLRHTATTRLIRAGVPASEVMKITGHTQLKTFLRYLNLTNESVTASAVALDGYLAEQKIGESGVIEVPDRFAQ